jgi:hypothetical protein
MGLGYHGNHPAHGARWLPPYCPAPGNHGNHPTHVVCPSMTHEGASLRTASHGNTAVNGMTCVTLLKIGGVLNSERRPHHDGL